jgi:hypothetical protein
VAITNVWQVGVCACDIEIALREIKELRYFNPFNEAKSEVLHILR